jgi:putative endonuclease
LRTAWIGLQERVLRRLAQRSRSRRRLPDHLATGNDGEREALFYLRRMGYTVVARRWRNPKLRGDLDLIAWDENSKEHATLCFIEIKTRTRRDAVPAEMAVDDDKRQTLRQLARSYIRRLPTAAQQAPTRFDVLSVYLESGSNARPSSNRNAGPDFVLNKGAFQWA